MRGDPYTIDPVVLNGKLIALSAKLDALTVSVNGIAKQLNALVASNQLAAETQQQIDALFAAVSSNKAKIQAAIDANA